ncbi:tetratricopeptide repeat protein [bacterium]|nr:tetratricopeptide repeat protein [bacterium]
MSEERPEPDKEKGVTDAFFVKLPDTPQIGSADAEKTEQQLLARFKSHGPRGETLKPLAVFYSRVGQQERAYQYLKMWMKYTKDKAELAECLLMSGQLAEQAGQPEPAVSFYREALDQKSDDFKVNYYCHNNLAYCLNLQGDFEQAQKHCHAAIRTDPSRANAYKNLGISQEGLGKVAEAARAWIKATHVDISDARAFQLLEKLMEKNSATVTLDIPDIAAQIDSCRKAMTTSQTGRFSDWARGLPLN